MKASLIFGISLLMTGSHVGALLGGIELHAALMRNRLAAMTDTLTTELQPSEVMATPVNEADQVTPVAAPRLIEPEPTVRGFDLVRRKQNGDVVAQNKNGMQLHFSCDWNQSEWATVGIKYPDGSTNWMVTKNQLDAESHDTLIEMIHFWCTSI